MSMTKKKNVWSMQTEHKILMEKITRRLDKSGIGCSQEEKHYSLLSSSDDELAASTALLA